MNTPVSDMHAAPDTSGEAQRPREELIARAAYLRAERRGFEGGDPLADWLEAEVEIDALLSRRPPEAKLHEPMAQREVQPGDTTTELESDTERLERLRPGVANLETAARKETGREVERLDAWRAKVAERARDVRRRTKKPEGLKQQAEKLLRELKAGLERLGSRFDR